MNEEMTQQLAATAERLSSAAESLSRVLEKLDAQQEALNAKVDLIVAAVEDRGESNREQPDDQTLQTRVVELEKANAELKAQATRMSRKTLSPAITASLGKNRLEGGSKMDSAVLDKTLQILSVEQRIAVKAEMARAGMIE
jgi:predicted ribosome quality control (RQC) complex YloA/Tae2 family protein